MHSLSIEEILSHWFDSFFEPVSNLYVVGGAVRDRLLGLPAGDLDLVCDDAQAVAAALAEKRGAAMVAFTKKEFSPCFRLIERRRPALCIDIAPLKGGEIRTDLAARDFTINAMAMEVTPGARLGDLLDPFAGAGDLGLRLVRMTTQGAFAADPLRVLRAFRFAAGLDFTIEPATLAEAARTAPLMSATAGERIRVELESFLDRGRVSRLAGTMVASGVIDALFAVPGEMDRRSLPVRPDPAPGVLAGVERILENPEEVFESYGPIANQILDRPHRRFLLKTAALLFDALGCFSVETADAAARRLRMPRRDRERFCLLAAGKDFFGCDQTLKYPHIEELEWFRRLGDEVPAVSILATAAAEVRGLPDVHRDRIRKAALRYVAELRALFSLPPLVRGKDLSELGIPHGPMMGEILKHIRNARDRGEIREKAEALRLAMRIYREKLTER